LLLPESAFAKSYFNLLKPAGELADQCIAEKTSWSYRSTTLVVDLFVPANSTITINASTSLNSGFIKSDSGHFFGYLISE
jgi:hypothetical protein